MSSPLGCDFVTLLIMNSASDSEFFHNCSLKGGKRTISEQTNNAAFSWHMIEPPSLWSQVKSRTTKQQNQGWKTWFNSLLSLKCGFLFQMLKQSYPSLFKLTAGFIPISIKRHLCNFDYKPMSLMKNWHRQFLLSRDHFSNYLKEHDEAKALFLQTVLLKFIL